MKQRLVQVLDNMKKYNAGVMYQEIFGFDPDTFYDVLVVAPGWKPTVSESNIECVGFDKAVSCYADTHGILQSR
jgi:hypothetical protein